MPRGASSVTPGNAVSLKNPTVSRHFASLVMLSRSWMSSRSRMPVILTPAHTAAPTPPATSVGSFCPAVFRAHSAGSTPASLTHHPSLLQPRSLSGTTFGNTSFHLGLNSMHRSTTPAFFCAAVSPTATNPFDNVGCFPIHHATSISLHVVFALSGGAIIAPRLFSNLSLIHAR